MGVVKANKQQANSRHHEHNVAFNSRTEIAIEYVGTRFTIGRVDCLSTVYRFVVIG